MPENATSRGASGHAGAARISRRGVLAGAGLGAGALLLTCGAGAASRASANGVWEGGRGAAYALWNQWRDGQGIAAVAAAGTLAANPHNIQPWRLRLGGDAIELFDDPARAMPIGDPDRRERMAGYGCALQNMVVAARSLGLDAEVHVPGADDGGPVAILRLRAGARPRIREQELAAAISARHSNRGPYTRRELEAGVIEALVADAPPGASVVWITDPSARDVVGALCVEAAEAIVADEAMSVEAFSWFRSERIDIDANRDGLTLDCQGLDRLTLLLAKLLPPQSRHDGDRFWVESTREVQTKTAAAYGIIRAADATDRGSRIASGRLAQHVHLAATAAGLALQHMNQVTERIARDADCGVSDRFSARWAAATGVPASEALLAFRIGYPEREPGPSPRRALSDVIG